MTTTATTATTATTTATTAMTATTATTATTASKPKPKSTCDYEMCKLKRAMIIGDCAYCALKYCAQHRLPEMHKCSNLDACCKNAKKENSDRLASQALSMVMKV
jgi:predicted nucleic acid binding AN1-type Zn finger protein